MKHRYVICFLIISLLVGMLCVPVSANSVLDFEYTLDYTEDGETFITVSIPLDNSIKAHSYWDDTIFYGPSFNVTIPGDVEGEPIVGVTFQSPYIDFDHLPESSTVSVSAKFTANYGHCTPKGSMFIEYNKGLGGYEEDWSNPDSNGELVPWYILEAVQNSDWYTFVDGIDTNLGGMTLEKGDAESFAVGVYLDRFGSIYPEDTEYTITLTRFDVSFSLDAAYYQQIQTGKTNKLLEDLKDSNKEISDKLDQIANALEPAPGAGESAKEEAAVQGGMIDDLNGQMNQLKKPNLSDQGSISDIISPGDLTSYTTFLASMVNAPYISSVVMLALILSLAAYVLFGKRG